MTNNERKAKALCRKIVMAAGICEKCSQAGTEQHHGLFRSSQRVKLNPALLCDPDLQFCLCGDCHRLAPDSPHVDGVAFFQKMKGMGGARAYKAYKVATASQGRLVVVKDRDIDWGKVLMGLKETENGR